MILIFENKRHHNEWFKLNEKDLKFIKDICDKHNGK